ncbi:hypothetical protein ACFU5O_06665 [Streptomyces sp. NPDC057445]|uniref:hypothetical protein n=1 Tax=Streptomyces sp. NPDC057445 TaxID=3346136 RepID=UPI0036CA5017
MGKQGGSPLRTDAFCRLAAARALIGAGLPTEEASTDRQPSLHLVAASPVTVVRPGVTTARAMPAGG